MQDTSAIPNHQELLNRIIRLESNLLQMQRRQRDRRRIGGAALVAVFACITLWAQGGAPAFRAPFKIVGANGQTIFSVTETSPGAATLEMKNSGGKRFAAGVGSTGNPFTFWDGTSGQASIGAPADKNFALRLYPAGATAPTIALSPGPQIAQVTIGSNGVPKLMMKVEGTDAGYLVLDDTGTRVLSNLTRHPGGGGNLELANGAGQIVAFMDANPANSEGRATYTNAAGQSLVKIGAAGDHGDVLLFGNNKAVPLWEMSLTLR